MRKLNQFLLAVSAALLVASAGGAPPSAKPLGTKYHHVLLISIDGMHAVDLSNYIASSPSSALAQLAKHGIQYPNALTTAPSDSFPGLTAQVTGATPKSAGVFYDVSYDRSLFAPGSNCVGSPGTVTTYDESIDVDSSAYDAGGTLGDVHSQIDATQLPQALVKGHCVPLYPHSFLEVNTIFEVIRQHGGQTAWADKHPAYDLVNGPSGMGVDDLFTPEVNSDDSTDGMTVFASDPSWFALNNAVTNEDTTKGFHSIARNDLRKVHAALNEIDGYASTDDGHQTPVGVPTILGMNFQAVSVGQKLAVGNSNDPLDCVNPADCLSGGYLNASGTKLNTGLQFGLDFVDSQIGAIVSELQSQDLADDTLIIISAKHGQSPIDPGKRQAFDDGPYAGTPGYAHATTDDVALVWLEPGLQQKDYKAAEAYLQSEADALGIVQLLDKADLAPLYGNPFGNERTPDFIAITKQGLIYTSGTKLAEHGGFAHDDRNVALLVSNPSIRSSVNPASVETRQIAPSILTILGISPKELDGVRRENTRVLPGNY